MVYLTSQPVLLVIYQICRLLCQVVSVMLLAYLRIFLVLCQARYLLVPLVASLELSIISQERCQAASRLLLQVDSAIPVSPRCLQT